jgi:ATP-dependent phosphoenolpyruvate carboxykinase
MLQPKSVWKDPKAYDRKVEGFAAMFKRNLQQTDFGVPGEVAGPAV